MQKLNNVDRTHLVLQGATRKKIDLADSFGSGCEATSVGDRRVAVVQGHLLDVGARGIASYVIKIQKDMREIFLYSASQISLGQSPHCYLVLK